MARVEIRDGVISMPMKIDHHRSLRGRGTQLTTLGAVAHG